jgi:hypothetical protein
MKKKVRGQAFSRFDIRIKPGYTENICALLYFKAQSLKHKDKVFNYGGNRAKNI